MTKNRKIEALVEFSEMPSCERLTFAHGVRQVATDLSEEHGGREDMTMSPEALAERDVVLHTLDESRADFRTVDGIVDETGIARDIVEEVLSKSPDAVRVSLASGPHGKLLYTRRDKPVTFRERVATLQQMASLV